MQLLKNSNFRLHWASLAVAQTGSFFTLVAVPWLGMSLEGADAIVVTTLLAASSLPNSIFILLGGAVADRFSPLRTLVFSRSSFAVAILSLAALTATGLLTLPILYVYAFVLGTLGALGLPASQSLLPQIVPAGRLGAANAVVMGTLQVAQMIAPVAAGWLLWSVRQLRGVPEGAFDPLTFASAFAVDGIGALVALFLILRVRVRPTVNAPVGGAAQVFALLGAGLEYSWRSFQLRLVLGYVMVASFFVQGPLLAALPLFTRLQLGLTERTYGTLYAMLGLGTVIGAGIAVASRPAPRQLGGIVLLCDLLIGSCLAALSRTHSSALAALLLALAGSGLGFTMVAGTTWFQLNTPARLMGRMMSFIMFAVVGLVPASASLAGYIISRSSVGTVLGLAGLTVASCAIVGLALPPVRRMGDIPAPADDPVARIPSQDSEYSTASSSP